MLLWDLIPPMYADNTPLNWLRKTNFIYTALYLNKRLISAMITIPSKLQSVTKYLGLTLVFTWNSALREKINFYFSRNVVTLSFWHEGWALGYHSMEFRHFPDISQFPKILSLKSFANSWGNLYIPCL